MLLLEGDHPRHGGWSLFILCAPAGVMYMAPKAKTLLHIDTTQMQQTVGGLKNVLSDRQMNVLIYRTLKRTGEHARTLVARDVTHEYHVNYGYALHSIGKPQMGSGGGISCIMPVSNARKKLARSGGPHFFKAVASSNKTGRKVSKKRFHAVGARGGYNVQAQILKGETSKLPSHGKTAHFMISGGPLEGQVYTRKSDGSKYVATVKYKTKNGGVKTYKTKKAAIRPGVGIGMPQMPINRSAEEIQRGTQALMMKRLEHEYDVMVQGIAKIKGK